MKLVIVLAFTLDKNLLFGPIRFLLKKNISNLNANFHLIDLVSSKWPTAPTRRLTTAAMEVFITTSGTPYSKEEDRNQRASTRTWVELRVKAPNAHLLLVRQWPSWLMLALGFQKMKRPFKLLWWPRDPSLSPIPLPTAFSLTSKKA